MNVRLLAWVGLFFSLFSFISFFYFGDWLRGSYWGIIAVLMPYVMFVSVKRNKDI